MRMAQALHQVQRHAGRSRRSIAAASPRVLASLHVFPASHSDDKVQSGAFSTSITASRVVSGNQRNLQHSLVRLDLPGFAYSSSNGNHHQRMYKSTTAGSSKVAAPAAGGTTADEDSSNASAKKPFSTIVAPAAGTVATDEDTSSAPAKKNKKPWILDLGIPALLPEWRDMFKKETLFTDISAGITVGCIAVPLSLAIAVASGVPAEVGLVTAAVSGVAGGLIGGTTLAVTGPAAAISLLVVSAVQAHGLEALPFITLATGGLQFASGVTRLGVAAKLVPVSVIAGFTTGVGAMILTGQVPKALGIAAPAGMNPLETFAFLGENISAINPAAAALAIGTSAAMFGLPKIHAKMPSALLAVGGATVATHTCGLDVSLIGAIPSGLEAFQFGLPMLPSVESLPSLGATVLLIYAMTSAESLLSCAALEKMKKTSYKHNPDQELVGQGMANMGAAMFMGMPVTSVIARSGLNVRLNAATRLPALVQAGFVFSSVVFFSDKIAMIPMPALSGMLITTGLGMLNPAEFKHCHAVDEVDTIPFLLTIGGMIGFGLAEGIGIGCVSSLLLNYDYGKLQISKVELPSKTVDPVDGSAQNEKLQVVEIQDPSSTTTAAWKLNGPINFRSMFLIDDMMHRIEEERKNASPDEAIVLDMKGVTTVEFTGCEELVNRLIEVANNEETPIKMWNCNTDLMNALKQCDPRERISAHDDLTSSMAPYHFPGHEKEKARKPVPFWYDSPNFRPDA